MPFNPMCPHCCDRGYTGFLNPDGWLAGEVMWTCLDWMIKTVCPTCGGDPVAYREQMRPKPPPFPPPKKKVDIVAQTLQCLYPSRQCLDTMQRLGLADWYVMEEGEENIGTKWARKYAVVQQPRTGRRETIEVES